jgi:MarR family transcriptional regulator for hemolysin
VENNLCERPLGKLFSEMAKAYVGNFIARLGHLGINRNYYALVVIDHYKGNLSQTTLGEELFLDKASVVRMLDYLEAEDCIMRKQNPKDRRAHLLKLTPKALEMVPEIKKAVRESNAICFDMAENMGCKNFPQNLEKMMEALHAEHIDRYDIHFNEKTND